MCHGVIDIAAFEARHQIDFASLFRAALARLRALATDGLDRVVADAHRGDLARPLPLRIIAMCFDAYLARPREVAPGYSKAL